MPPEDPTPWDSAPLVSVIIPAYNAESFIERTLQSVLDQTYQNIEVLVVDDGSCDRTPEIVRLIAQQDPRVVLLQQSNFGVAAARNLAIQMAKGEFIAPIDADDIWYPDNIEKQVCCIVQSGPLIGFVYSWSLEINEEDDLSGGFHVATYRNNVYLRLLHHDFLGHASATLIRRACFEAVGGYDCSLREKGAQGCEDWDVYLRIAERYLVNVVPEFLVGYRRSNSSMSHNSESMAKSHELVLRTALEQHPEIPSQVFQWSMSNFCVYLAHQNCQAKQYRISQIWLYRAFILDWTMVILRPDLYLLLAYYFIGLLSASIKPSQILSGSGKNLKSRQAVQISDIHNRVRIRNLFPSKLYENFRLNALVKSGSLAGIIPLKSSTRSDVSVGRFI